VRDAALILQAAHLETAAEALVCLLQSQPALADSVPALGHIPRICAQMTEPGQDVAIHRAAISILHQLAVSDVSESASQGSVTSFLRTQFQRFYFGFFYRPDMH